MSAMPSATRVCRPRSPKTAFNNSEAPLSTKGCLRKPGHAVDISLDADNLSNLFQVAEGRFELGDGVDGALPGRRVALFQRQFVSHLARVEKLVAYPGKLARRDDKIAGAKDGDIGADTGRRRRQFDLEFRKLRFSGSGAHGDQCSENGKWALALVWQTVVNRASPPAACSTWSWQPVIIVAGQGGTFWDGKPAGRGIASLRSGLLMQPLRRSLLPLRATLAGCWACRRRHLPLDHTGACYRETSLMNESSIESVRRPLKHFHAVLIVLFAIREVVLFPALAAYLVVCLLNLLGLTERMSPAAWFVAAPAALLPVGDRLS